MVKSSILKSFIYFRDVAYFYKLTFQYRNEINKKTINKPKRLNKKQIAEIKEYYTKYGCKKIKTTWHEFYFGSNNIYSEKYIPEDLFHATISKRLNQMRQWPSLLDKNLLYLIFKDYKQPEVVLKNVNGFYFLGDKVVSKAKAIESISYERNQMIIKPSIDSGNGNGVVVFSVQEGNTNYNNLSVEDFLSTYKKDFIVQLVVKQHEVLKSLNDTSLNTLRVISYLNEGGVYILSTIVRIGKKGSFTDNCSTGGIACGVSDKGILKEYGYLNDGTVRKETDNGVLLGNITVPSYKIVMEQVKKMHLLIPYFRIVSWDLGIDNAGTPLLIEYNTYHQDITIHQLANGPLFGEFTDEILSQIKV